MGKGLKIRHKTLFDINRRIIAHSTQKAWNEAPHVSYLYEPDITDFITYITKKEEFNKKNRISFNTIMLKIISEGLKKSPILNSILQYNPKTKVGWQSESENINIALPWLLEDGRMITPIVKNIEDMDLKEISLYISELSRKIKNTDIDAMQYQVSMEETIDEIKHFNIKVIRQIIAAKIGPNRIKNISKAQKKAYKQLDKNDKITSSDIFDASVLVSNIGSVFKSQKGALTILEIITPQVFVIGLNAIQERAGVFINSKGEKEIGIRKILPFCMTFDHRAADFADLIPFQNRLDEIFNNPKLINKWI